MLRLLTAAASLLVLPLAALLFGQWPLRDLVQAGSRQANDLAQVIFAVYMAVAILAASRAGAHLSAHGNAGQPPRWRAWAVAACVAPWSLFLLWTSAAGVWQSVAQQERFAETLNPGYFVVKASLWLMAALILLHAIHGLARRADLQ